MRNQTSPSGRYSIPSEIRTFLAKQFNTQITKSKATFEFWILSFGFRTRKGLAATEGPFRATEGLFRATRGPFRAINGPFRACPAYAILYVLLNSCATPTEPFQQSHADFSFIAIGDTGEKSDILENNAKTLRRMLAEDSFQVMVMLGDNFYPIGLNVPEHEVDEKISEVLSPLYEVMRPLRRENVHALSGNHDYYAFLAVSKSLFFGLVNIEEGPYGIDSRGNRREANRIPEWTYHYGLPRDRLYGPIDRRIQMIFFDSAILLRTRTEEWSAALDSLSRLLLRHKQDANVRWRILFAHHPFYSLGPHGGYSVWDDSAMAVKYLNPCSLDSNSIGYTLNVLDHQDLCAPRYQAYVDSVPTVIARSGVRVQLVVAGHEHNLQLLYYPDKDRACAECPKVHIVSGAGAIANEVKSPVPGREWTWPVNTPEARGRSRYGFVRFDLKGESLRVRVFDGKSGELLKVKEKGEVVINEEGEVKFK